MAYLRYGKRSQTVPFRGWNETGCCDLRNRI